MVTSMDDFEVIENFDDIDPYLAPLGIYEALDNQVIINMKKRKMIFEFGNV